MKEDKAKSVTLAEETERLWQLRDIKERKHGIIFNDPSRAKQSHKDGADINTIMRDFANGKPLPFRSGEPMFKDNPGIDFNTAMQVITQAKNKFDMLPSDLREHFNNKPGEFVAFIENPENREEAEALGLVAPRTPEFTEKTAEPIDKPPKSENAPQEGS